MAEQDVFIKKPKVQRTPPAHSDRDSESDSIRGEREKRTREEEVSPREKEKKKQKAMAVEREELERRKKHEKVLLQYRQRTASTGSNAGEREESRRLLEELATLRKEKEEWRKREENRSRSMEEPTRTQIGKIKESLKEIMDAVPKENAGKISVTRADQQTVKQAVMEIQDVVIKTLLAQVELYKEKEKIKEDLQRVEEKVRNIARRNITGDSDDSEMEEGERRIPAGELGMNVNNKVSERGVIGVEYREGGKRSYADISRGKPGERFQGSRTIAGGEGWRTPPHKNANEVVVTSELEQNALKLAEKLAKSIRVKYIEGTPQGVFKRADGGVVIVPKSDTQREKITSELKKCEGLTIRDRRYC